MPFPDYRSFLASGNCSDILVRISLDCDVSEPPQKLRRRGEAAADAAPAALGDGERAASASEPSRQGSSRTVLCALQMHRIVLEEASEWARGLPGGFAEVRCPPSPRARAAAAQPWPLSSRRRALNALCAGGCQLAVEMQTQDQCTTMKLPTTLAGLPPPSCSDQTGARTVDLLVESAEEGDAARAVLEAIYHPDPVAALKECAPAALVQVGDMGERAPVPPSPNR